MRLKLEIVPQNKTKTARFRHVRKLHEGNPVKEV